MINTGISQEEQEKILAIIHSILPKCKVYLFGSRTQGQHYIGSDLDLAIDAGAPIDPEKIYLIKKQLEETGVPRKIDIVDLFSASDIFKQEVKEKGILWKK